MKKVCVLWMILAVLLAAFCATSFAKVESSVIQTLNLDSPPLDVAVSPDGQKLYILTDNGRILIYSGQGQLSDTLTVDKDIDAIRISRSGDILFLSSQKSKKVQIVLIDFIQDIDISDSPYKGPENAPVVIIVFSDFQ